MKQRLTYFDNAKAILIFFVVFGHFVDLVCHSTSAPLLRYTFLMIWSFHMPAFIFIAGLFDHPRDGFPAQRVAQFFCIGVALKVFNNLVLFVFPNVAAEPSMFSDKNFPWYMFAMAAFISLCYLLKKIPAPVVLIGSLCVALVAGYFPQIGDFLYLSRIFVFFPVYYFGYILSPETVASVFDKKIIHICCAIGLISLLIFVALHLDSLYNLRPLFTGRNAYNEWVLSHHGAAMRVLAYGISAVVTFFFFGIIPTKKLPLISQLGTATLPIYCLHYYPIFLLDGLGVISFMEAGLQPAVLLIVFFVFAFIETIVLSQIQKIVFPE